MGLAAAPAPAACSTQHKESGLKKKLAQSLAILAVAAAAGASHAQSAYVGGNVGTTDWRADSINGVPGSNKGTSYKLYGGYAFTPNVALELGYADLAKYSGNGAEAKGHGPYVDVVGKVPLANDFSAIGRIGAFNGKVTSNANGVSSSSSGTNAKLGLGVQYDLSKTSGIRGEWERYRFSAFNDKVNADMFSVGYVQSF